jgi:hypothetical protein
MTIERYLAELEGRLPRVRRRRFLAEAGEHLRDSADRHRSAGLSPEEAEAAAVADFGTADDVARRFQGEAAVAETRVASFLVLAAVLCFVFPLYVVPENTLPPAAWDAKPRDIGVLQAVTVGLWIAALGLATLGAALAWTRRSTAAAWAARAAALTVAAAGLGSAALVWRWFAAAPSTPEWPLLAAPLALGCIATCLVASEWAWRRRRLLA